MNKKISSYQLLVAGIILVIASYFLFVHRPMNKKIEQLQAERQTLESSIASMQPMVQEIANWQAELDKVYAKYDEPISIPDYDNMEEIIAEMNEIFNGVDDYHLTFADETVSNNIVTRNINVVFSCEQYENLRTRLQAIHDSHHKYQLTNMSIGISTSSGTYNWGFGTIGDNSYYSVTLGLVAHEYSEDNVIMQKK